MIDFDALRTGGSWRLTWSGDRLDEAVFRLEPGAAQPESSLIEALLTDPASAGLSRLELHLTDVHLSATAAARALATWKRERLTSLYFGHDFTYLYEHFTTSSGEKFDPLSRLHEGFADDTSHRLWDALPALQELTAEGGLLFDDIDGDAMPALTDLRLRGAVLAEGAVFPRRAPGVVTLALETGHDIFGSVCPVEQLEELTPGGYPALRHLDLGLAEFDADDLDILETLAASPVLPQLETLEARNLLVDDVAALTRLAPAFAHLSLSVYGDLDDAAADVLGVQA
ncbi:hypothetical protein [Herbidospora sp. RD11066]